MNELKEFYTANLDNEVVLFATNLKEFIELMRELEPTAVLREVSSYQKEFIKTSIITLFVSDTKIYNLQMLFNRL